MRELALVVVSALAGFNPRSAELGFVQIVRREVIVFFLSRNAFARFVVVVVVVVISFHRRAGSKRRNRFDGLSRQLCRRRERRRSLPRGVDIEQRGRHLIAIAENKTFPSGTLRRIKGQR